MNDSEMPNGGPLAPKPPGPLSGAFASGQVRTRGSSLRLTPQEESAVNEFLIAHAEHYTLDQIVETWNRHIVETRGFKPITLNFVRHRIKTLGVKPTWKEAMLRPHSIAKRTRSAVKKGQKVSAKFAKLRAGNERRLMALRDKVLAERTDLQVITCPTCPPANNRWPLTEQFFRTVRTKQPDGGTREHFITCRCKICFRSYQRREYQLGRTPIRLKEVKREEQLAERSAVEKQSWEKFIQLLRIRDQLFAADQGQVKRSCCTCGQLWPETKQWFPQSKGRNKLPVFTRECLWCCNSIRRLKARALADREKPAAFSKSVREFFAELRSKLTGKDENLPDLLPQHEARAAAVVASYSKLKS